MDRPRGLPNNNLVCWFNSVTQLLASSNSLKKNISQPGSSYLHRVVSWNWNGYSIRGYDGVAMQDVHEFFININKKRTIPRDLFFTRQRVFTKCLRCGAQRQITPDENVYISNVKFNKDGSINLSSVEKREITCERCSYKYGEVQSHISHAPKILMLYSSRNPTSFTLDRFNYKLQGQVIYTGVHYYAIGYRSKKIYILNDTTITQTNEFAPKSFLALYDRTN